LFSGNGAGGCWGECCQAACHGKEEISRGPGLCVARSHRVLSFGSPHAALTRLFMDSAARSFPRSLSFTLVTTLLCLLYRPHFLRHTRSPEVSRGIFAGGGEGRSIILTLCPGGLCPHGDADSRVIRKIGRLPLGGCVLRGSARITSRP